MVKLERAHMQYEELSARHKLLIPSYKEKLQDISLCIAHNYEIIKCILAHTNEMFENMQSGTGEVGF